MYRNQDTVKNNQAAMTDKITDDLDDFYWSVDHHPYVLTSFATSSRALLFIILRLTDHEYNMSWTHIELDFLVAMIQGLSEPYWGS